jgi:hypothetical protein
MARFRQETEYRRYGYIDVEAKTPEDASDLVYEMSDQEKANLFVQTDERWVDAEEWAYPAEESGP